jgi:hypothetical protein
VALRVNQHHLKRVLESNDADAIVRSACRISIGWDEFVDKYGKYHPSWKPRHETEAAAICAIKSALSSLPPEAVSLALIRNLSIRRSLVATSYKSGTPHDLSPLRIQSKAIMAMMDLLRLRTECDKLLNQDQTVNGMLSTPSPVIHLNALLRHADGFAYSRISRDRLVYHEYNGMGCWIERIGRSLFSYGFYYTDW